MTNRPVYERCPITKCQALDECSHAGVNCMADYRSDVLEEARIAVANFRLELKRSNVSMSADSALFEVIDRLEQMGKAKGK